MSKPYRVCPHCGSHLDPGERCDCQDKREPETTAAAGKAAAPAVKNRHEPVLMPGA